MLMDAVFGVGSFKNEIQWRRYGSHNDVGQGSKHYGRVHDVVLFYVRGGDATWNQVFTPLDERYVAETYRYVDSDGRQIHDHAIDWSWRIRKRVIRSMNGMGILVHGDMVVQQWNNWIERGNFITHARGILDENCIWTNLAGSRRKTYGPIFDRL